MRKRIGERHVKGRKAYYHMAVRTARNKARDRKEISNKEMLAELFTDKHVREMKRYRQHGQVSTYEHCKNVARLSFKVDRKLRLHSNKETLIKGAMLHDFYLYDWHEGDGGTHRLHGFSHAETACRNARKYFSTDAAVNHVIYSHMWPLNLTKIPASREAWVVCFADKIAALSETLFRK